MTEEYTCSNCGLNFSAEEDQSLGIFCPNCGHGIWIDGAPYSQFEQDRRVEAARQRKAGEVAQAREPRAIEVMANVNLQEGAALAGKGKHKKALKKYDTAIRMCPEMASAWTLKGMALLNLERYQEASQCLDRALALEPNDGDTLLYKGIALRSLGHEQAGIQYIERARELGCTLYQ